MECKTVWIRKGTVINKMLDFLDLKYPSITSITEVPIEKAMTEYRTYLTKRVLELPLLIIRLLLIKKNTCKS